MTTLEPKTNFRPSHMLHTPERGGLTAAEPRSLAEAVQAAVSAVDESTLRPVARRDAGLAFQPKTLLALVTYCYARGTYGSTDIEDMLRRDVHFRQLCRNEFPGANVLRRFRRDNREDIWFCLTAALRFMAEQKVATGSATKITEAQLAEEAMRRIIMAMFIDNMELNGD